MFEHPGNECYLSKYFSLFLAKAIVLMKYKYSLMNKGFIIFVFLTQ